MPQVVVSVLGMCELTQEGGFDVHKLWVRGPRPPGSTELGVAAADSTAQLGIEAGNQCVLGNCSRAGR